MRLTGSNIIIMLDKNDIKSPALKPSFFASKAAVYIIAARATEAMIWVMLVPSELAAACFTLLRRTPAALFSKRAVSRFWPP